jgi:anti-sigma factor RsiW
VKCAEFLNELTNYLDGAIDARTKAELEDHLAWCHNCYVVCDTTKKTIEIYRDRRRVRSTSELSLSRVTHYSASIFAAAQL